VSGNASPIAKKKSSWGNDSALTGKPAPGGFSNPTRRVCLTLHRHFDYVQCFCPTKGNAMTVETTYSQAREQLKTLMDRAVDDREIILVKRRTGGDVAMIAADELQSLMETAHLLRSPKNAQRLLNALARARTESIAPIPMNDLQHMVGFDA